MSDLIDTRIGKQNEAVVSSLSQSKSEKRTYTVFEIQGILGISKTTAYNLIKSNVFHSVRVGGHIRISKKSFDEWLDNASEGVQNG